MNAKHTLLVDEASSKFSKGLTCLFVCIFQVFFSLAFNDGANCLAIVYSIVGVTSAIFAIVFFSAWANLSSLAEITKKLESLDKQST